MQYTTNNNSYSRPSANPKRKLALVITLLVALLVIIFIVVSIVGRQDVEDPGGQYVDPASGETISDPEGKTPEKFGQTDEGPLILGLSKLYDVGVTQYQVKAIEIAFELFSKSQSEPVKEISIFVDTVKMDPLDLDSSIRRFRFDILVNRTQKYDAVIESNNLTTARLILRSNGKAVFRSEVIDPQEFDEH